MNHSETVFVRQRPNSNSNSFDIRWYTPIAEEPFCGHGVLGATHALHAARLGTNFDFTTFTGIKASATIIPSTTSNSADREHVTISMSFPSSPVLPSPAFSKDVKTAFAIALGIDPRKILAIGQNALMDIIIELDPDVDFSAQTMNIDPIALLHASPPGTRSQVVTSSWSFNPKIDFAKRVFAYGSEGTQLLRFLTRRLRISADDLVGQIKLLARLTVR